MSHPEDAIAKHFGLDKLKDVEDVFTVDSAGHVVPDQPDAAGNVISDGGEHTGAKPPKKVRAQFGRKRSHNEQIFVAPCGDIIARETFFGAEAVSSVVVSGKH